LLVLTLKFRTELHSCGATKHCCGKFKYLHKIAKYDYQHRTLSTIAHTVRPHDVRSTPGGYAVEFKLWRPHERTNYRITKVKFSPTSAFSFWSSTLDCIG